MPDATPVTDSRTVAEHARDVLDQRHPDWTDEQLVCHPVEALQLCKEVRRRTGRRAATLPDHDILRSLINARKAGRLKRDRPKN